MSKKLNHSLAIGIFLIGLFSANVSQAQTTWDNTGLEWTNGTSWVGDAAPLSNTSTGNTAVFSNVAAGNNTVNLGSGQSIGGVSFTTGANAYTFTGSALTVGSGGGISNNSATLQTFNNKVINNGSGTAVYGSYAGGSLLFNGGIDLTPSSSSASRTVAFLGSGAVTVSGAIAAGGTSTGGNLIFGNAAINTLSGNNTYFGTTTVSNASTLRLGSATALGATNGATEIKSGGALDLNGQTIGAEALTISGTGVSSSGAIFNSSASSASLSGNIAPTASSTIKATNGSIGISGGINLNGDGATSRTLTLDGTGGIIVSGNISNSFAGSTGALVIAATARNVTLSGNNSYNGTTTLTGGGGMNINSANAISTNTFTIGTSSFLNNTSGGAITNLGNNNITLADTLTFGTSSSTVANSLNLGTGTVTASSSRTITIAGTDVTLGLGTLDSISSSSGRTFTANGAGNTLSLAGWKIQSGSTSNVVAKLEGTANWTITGPIVNGNNFSNGVQISATGLTTFGGNNTYGGLTTMDAAAGTLTLSGDNSGAAGGVTLTQGTLNINNNNALGTGALTLGGTGATINNTSGSAVVNAGNQAWVWNEGLAFGSSANTADNNLNLGAGDVTASTSRTINLAGNNTKLTIGAVKMANAGSRTITANNTNGTGNTLEMGGLTLSSIATSPVTTTLAGTANINVTGAIVSGAVAGNGLMVAGTGTTTLSGDNTYTGATEFQNGTTIISGNNSAAVGNVTIAGIDGSKPSVRLDNINAISSSSSLLGVSGNAQLGTLDLRAAGNFSLNSYGLVGTPGNNMAFMNSSGSEKTLKFTAANNYITTASTGGRTLYNDSANLLLDFDGNIEIGGTSAAAEATTFAGVGNFNVDGNLLDNGTGLTRALRKQGDGTLTLRGSANSIRGSTLVEAGTLDLYGNLTASTGIVVSTSGTSANAGVRTASATINVRDGASLLNSSTTTVWSRGNLIVDGTAGAVVVENNGLVGGSGTVGAVTLKSGAFLTPGNSPGLLTASASSSWKSGSTYNWEINDAEGAAETNWDVFYVSGASGALDLSDLSGSRQMNLVLQSLSSGNLPSTNLANFSTSAEYTWVIAKAAIFTGIAEGTQDLTSYFNINTAAFNDGSVGNLPNGGFQVVTGTEGSLRTLNLMAIPEPSTGSMLGLGFAGLVVTRLLRRKSS
jgi:autotransporter-associated beta strand protein